MTDEKTKMFFELLRKNQGLFEKLPGNKLSDEDKQAVVLYITEISFISQQLIELVEKISNTNLKLSDNELDLLLNDLIYLKILIYDETVDWIKDLKRPLKRTIDSIADLIPENSEFEARDNAKIEKAMRDSLRQVKITIEKLKSSATKDNKKKVGNDE